jgi:hypothetical protein
MFSANSMSSLPISDDSQKPRKLVGAVKIFLNKATLVFTLNINRVTDFALSYNMIASFNLQIGFIRNVILKINKTISKILKINKIIDFSKRR